MANASSIAAVLGVCFYATGLFIVNAYLYSIGLSDFALFKAKYVYTGVIAFVPLVLSLVLPTFAIGHLARVVSRFQDDRKDHSILATVRALASAVTTNDAYAGMMFALAPAAVLFFWVTGDASVRVIAVSELSFWGFVGGSLVYILGRAWLTGATKWGENARESAREAFGLAVASLFLVLYLNAFAKHVYPVIPEQFGGGASRQVKLVFVPDYIDVAREIGISVEPGKNLSAPVEVVYESDDAFHVRVRDGALISLSKSVVRAVVR